MRISEVRMFEEEMAWVPEIHKLDNRIKVVRQCRWWINSFLRKKLKIVQSMKKRSGADSTRKTDISKPRNTPNDGTPDRSCFYQQLSKTFNIKSSIEWSIFIFSIMLRILQKYIRFLLFEKSLKLCLTINIMNFLDNANLRVLLFLLIEQSNRSLKVTHLFRNNKKQFSSSFAHFPV